MPLLITSRLVFVFIMPIGLGNIGWKMYMVNASWDIVIVVLIVSSVEASSYYIVTHLLLGCFLGRDERQDLGRNRCNF